MSETRFSGRQVVGIVLLIMLVLGLGLAAGGLIGYRLGKAEGAQAVAAAPQVRAPTTPNQRQTVPFGQALPNALATGGPYLGVEFQMITPALAASEGITGTTGAFIRSVVADSPAAKAGLEGRRCHHRRQRPGGRSTNRSAQPCGRLQIRRRNHAHDRHGHAQRPDRSTRRQSNIGRAACR